ncbi:M-phase phosphoprotein 6 [Entomortierella chlamydospora]|uniref:M-phase phosphoprotein 6 n=1 Tax=Entomortierella chlamydospora TaxID=101097 RepID=A0A9P6MQ59_9FUNG|nr:M-phase phosphoprotein 6 [Entomortierella chlamydospora]KAG0009652.1 M-phase phosphoprotein 6 [Entomortierella chlamydospora]
MTEVPHKKALSGKLLTMKFMQRQQERETREKLEKEQVRVITEAHWVLDHKGVELPKPKFQVEYEPSFLQMDSAERSSVGRVSFQKFNEDIEKIASNSAGKQQLERELKRERQGEIGDDEMAEELGGALKAKKTKTSSGSSSPNVSTKPTTNRRVPPKQANNTNSDGSNNGNEKKPVFMKPRE